MHELYTNIRNRRREIGMSQDELAKAAGYTDRSSIAKIEAGKIDLSQSKIKALADALDISASILMGWDEPLERAHIEEVLQVAQLFESAGYSAFLRQNVDDSDKDKSVGMIVSFDRKIYYDIDSTSTEGLSNEIKSFIAFKIKELIEKPNTIQYSKKEVLEMGAIID